MDNELVFFRGWTRYVWKLSLCCGEIVIFKFQIGGCFKVTVFRFDTSTQEVYRCSWHGKRSGPIFFLKNF